MKTTALLRVEFHRILKEKLTWLIILLSVISPMAGIRLYHGIPSMSPECYTSSLNSTYIGNLAMAGALCCVVLFIFFTARQLSNVYTNKVDKIIFSIVSESKLLICRTVSVIFIAVLTQLITILIWLPYTMIKVGELFRIDLMIKFYLAIMLPAMLIAILITGMGFLITQRFGLAMVLPFVLLVLNLSAWSRRWLLSIFIPLVHYIFDDFGNQRVLQSVLYVRLVWLLIALGGFVLSCLCIRRYEKSLFYSIRKNIRKIYLPLISALLFTAGVLAYVKQPMLDKSVAKIDYKLPYNFDFEYIICNSIHLKAMPNLSNGSFHGIATYDFKNYTKKEQEITYWIQPGYKIYKATANGKKVEVVQQGKVVLNQKMIKLTLPADDKIELVLHYGGYPQEWNKYETYQGNMEISKDYMYLSKEVLLPSARSFVCMYGDDFLTVDMSLPKGMTPVLYKEGTAEYKDTLSDGLISWKITLKEDNTFIYVGDYVCSKIKTKNLNVNFYYSKKRKAIIDKYNVDSIIKEVFDYCTDHYGPLMNEPYVRKSSELMLDFLYTLN